MKIPDYDPSIHPMWTYDFKDKFALVWMRAIDDTDYYNWYYAAVDRQNNRFMVVIRSGEYLRVHPLFWSR